MSKSKPDSKRSERSKWIAFTLSGAIAAGAAYWVSAQRTPKVTANFRLPSVNSIDLAASFRLRLNALEAEITAGNHLIPNLTKLGRLAHASGLPDLAEVCWTQLAIFQPDNAHWPYYLADLARGRRDNAQELTFLLRARELDPVYPPIPLHLANLYFREGKLAAAQAAFSARLALLPNDAHARLGLARIAQREGRAEDRFAMLQELVEVAPDFPSGHNLFAAELLAKGEIETARKHRWLGHSAGRWTNAADPWLDQLDEDCFDPGRLYVLATRDFQLNRNDAAMKWLDRVSELKPNDFANLEFQGDLFLKLKQPQEAIDAMEQALALSTNQKPSITLFINLVEAYRQKGDLTAALRVSKSGLIHHPDSVELHNSVGVCLNALGDKPGAISAFHKAIERQPFEPDANFNLGYILLELEQEEAGIAAIRKSLTLQPTFGKALTFLGQYELEVGDLSVARELLERLYDAYWGIPDARKLWADWHFKAGAMASASDEAKAELLYRQGLAIDDEVPDLHLGLGALLIAQNRIDEAIISLNRFQQLSSNDSRGFLYLGQAFLAQGKRTEARQQLQIALELANANGLSATAERCRSLLSGL